MSQLDATPPTPLSALFVGGIAIVTFSEPLAPATLDVANWSLRYDNLAYQIIDAVAAGSDVTLTIVDQGVDPGPNVCSYAASPPDLLDLAGTPAVAFSDFPVI